MTTNLIQWPRAKYWEKCWNPIIGCRPCSPACEHCYARAWADRFKQNFQLHKTGQKPPQKGVVFCGNMTDLFAEWSDENLLITRQFSRDATYLWLTKRVATMCDDLFYSNIVDFRHYSKNHYFGFTAENQEWYNDRRATTFMRFPEWANLWLSAEPLLGPIDLRQLYPTKSLPFKWVVVGCESGPNRRPCKTEWVEDIVSQCLNAGIPVFVKQLDIDGKCITDISKFPKLLQIRQVPWKIEE